MPWMGRDLFQITVLLLCVPAQYLISTQWGSKMVNSERVEILKRLVLNAGENVKNYINMDFWRNWVLNVSKDLTAAWKRHQKDVSSPSNNNLGESPAMEVMEFKRDQGYFASSKYTRFPRTKNVRFCVGQIVRHKLLGYSGVIIGWDPVAKAPESWLEKMHPVHNTYWRNMPNYAILVDLSYRNQPQMTYVPQEHLEVLTDVQVSHPDMGDYFMAYTGDAYIPQPWLREIYPDDKIDKTSQYIV